MAARSTKPDAAVANAVDEAREALTASVPAADVGDYLGHAAEGERVVTHLFACERAGYRGWRWSVTVARASRQRRVTVDEIVLLPGEEAIVAPAWLPWRERVKPGDLGPGDLLPPDDDDPRLVPGYTAGDEIVDRDAVREVEDEIGLGRPQLLSLEGRDLAAQRWYDGSHGPDAPIAQAAPGTCAGCGFMVRLAGPLSTLFGVCANAQANDDGRVVSFDHGCGAHSEARLGRKNRTPALPEPVLDTQSWDELERF